jgi:hypothetical protein
MKYAKVKDHNDILRDQHSKALIAVDKSALEAHRKIKLDKQRLDNVERAVGEIGRDVAVIKAMLMALIPGAERLDDKQ